MSAGLQRRPLRGPTFAFLLALACFLLLPLAHAQVPATEVYSGPPVPPTPAQGEKFTVTGTVIDAVTGDPIRKTLVQINGPQQRTTFSDGDGRFQFDGLPAGMVSVTAQKPGYFGEQEMARGGVPPVEVSPKSGPVAIKLTPESIISGKVTTATGVPLEHVSLSLSYIEVREGRKHWDNKGTAISDPDGRFRFPSLKPGTYYLGVGPHTPIAENIFEPEQTPTTGYAGSYYPGVSDLSSASPIQLSAGQQAEANFSLNEVPVFNVSGTISGYAPNQGVGLQIFDPSGVQVNTGYQFSAENGRFDIHALAAGSYVLKAFSSADQNQAVRAEVRLNLASNLYNLHLALAPVPTIPVVVRLESKAQTGEASRRREGLTWPGPPLSVRLQGNGPGTNDIYASLEGQQGQQSLFLHNVEPGRYSATLDPRDSWYVASAEYGQTNLLTDDLVLTSGAPALPLNVVLRNDCASLLGTVHVPDGWLMPVTILAIPEGLAKASPKITNYYPPRDGNTGNAEFFLDGLAPGDYLVFAFDHAEGIEYADPEVLQNYAAQAVHVTLAPSQRAKIALEMIRTEEATN